MWAVSKDSAVEGRAGVMSAWGRKTLSRSPLTGLDVPSPHRGSLSAWASCCCTLTVLVLADIRVSTVALPARESMAWVVTVLPGVSDPELTSEAKAAVCHAYVAIPGYP